MLFFVYASPSGTLSWWASSTQIHKLEVASELKMDVINTIVGKMLEPITELLFRSTGRQIGYLVHYKQNIKNLEDEVEKLRDWKVRVEEDVDMALDNGMVVEEDVSKWLDKVQKTLEEEVKKLLEDKENLSCLDICSRHRLGREGKKKTMVVTGLKDEGNFDRVAHTARLTDIWCTSSTSYEHFESRKLVFEEIMEALKDDSVYKIGIYGMPGVGKTSIVEEVGKQAGKDLFDEVAMAVFSQIPDLNKIQGKLADCLNLRLDKESEEGRASQLCNRLKNGSKILVILDDVWGSQITLKKIGIPDLDNTKGCKILLTSRRLEVCKQMGFEKNLEIGLLTKPEAWQLFKRTVGDFIEADREMLSVAGKVCGKCDCLPLAILAIGAALKDEKGKHAWDDALEQLINFHGHKIEGVTEIVYSHIEWSYNYLKHADVQSCFLHCCLFPEDAEISIDTLAVYGVGMKFLESTDRTSMKKARDRTRVLVGILKKSYLLLEGRNENFVKMHDVIRDVAMSIASKDPNRFLVNDNVRVWPEKDDYKSCRAISLSISHNVCRLPDMFECPELRTLVFRCSSTNGSPLKLPDSFFKGMEHLEVLDLHRMELLPSLLSTLVNLRMLCLFYCRMENLSFLKELKNLEILVINVERSREMVLEIGQLTHLRLLDLRHCTGYNIILPSGVLSHLSELEELYTPENFHEWEVNGNASIVELNSLTSLTTLEIYILKNVISLTTNFPSFKSLKAYKIWIGLYGSYRDHLEGIYGSYREHSETKILGLEGVPLKVEFDILIANAEVLYLIQLKGLKKVLHDRDEEWFLDLRYLQVKKSDDMEHLLSKPKWSSQAHGPSPPGCFGKLSELEVDNCRLMKYLFSSSIARGLPKLQNLIIKNCESLEEIVGGDEEIMDKVTFHLLKEMQLECLPNLRSIYANKEKTATTECNPSTTEQALFNEKVMFPILEKLYIKGLNSVVIWDKQLLPILEEGNSFEHLQELKVEECEKMEEIVAFGEEEEANDETILFSQLKTMELVSLPNLKSFSCSCGSKKTKTSWVDIPQLQALFNHKVKFPSLENLHIWKIDNLKEIWDITAPTESVCKLRSLNVVKCDKLVNIVPSRLLGSFQNIERLQVNGCKSLEEVFIGDESNATEGTSGRDKAVGKEEENILAFHRLQSVFLSYLPCLTSFYKRSCIFEFPALVRVYITCCPVLEVLPLRYLDTAKRKTIDGHLQALSNEKAAFPTLEEVELSDGSVLEHICHGHIPPSCFSKVTVLNVNDCSKPVDCCTLLQIFESVDTLRLFDCSSSQVGFFDNAIGLNAIGRQGFQAFNNLIILRLNGCNGLRYLFSLSIAKDGFKQLAELHIWSCGAMEGIVRNEAQGPEDDGRDEIIILFPQLNYLRLRDCKSLMSFCGPNIIPFQLPALYGLDVDLCPEFWTTSGGTSKPVASLFGDRLHNSLMEDLNNFFLLRSYTNKTCFNWMRRQG